MEIGDLPNEMVLVIVSFLPLKDYRNVILSCRKLHQLGTSEPLYKILAVNVSKLKDENGEHFLLTKKEELLECYDCQTYRQVCRKIGYLERVNSKTWSMEQPKEFQPNVKNLKGKALRKFLQFAFKNKDESKGYISIFSKNLPKIRPRFSKEKGLLILSSIDFEKLSWGFEPFAMEEKWFIYMNTEFTKKTKEKVYLVHMKRSWTNIESYVMKFRRVLEDEVFKYQLFQIDFEMRHFFNNRSDDWFKDKFVMLEDFLVICGLLGIFLDKNSPFVNGSKFY